MPRMIKWDDKRAYSIAHDCEVGRVSGFDEHHQEHFMIVVAGKGYRERREDAVVRIMESIEAGDIPGEVKPLK